MGNWERRQRFPSFLLLQFNPGRGTDRDAHLRPPWNSRSRWRSSWPLSRIFMPHPTSVTNSFNGGQVDAMQALITSVIFLLTT